MNNLQIIPIGGMGRVTKNMFLYQYNKKILIVDCGIGFPELSMHGVDLLIPDTTYLEEQVEKGAEIVGMVLTHGHDDHIAALGYILPKLPDFPIYGSSLTAAFAEQRMIDFGIQKKITVLKDREHVTLDPFTIEPIAMTHSVPDTKHYIIHTPEGIVYHGTDFKIDLNPVDHVLPDFDRITSIGREGILCMLMDCLRIERPGFTPSESTVQTSFEREMLNVRGKIIVTLMSSSIHRIQQAVDTAIAMGRKVCFVGRSVEQNLDSALRTGHLHIDSKHMVSKKQAKHNKDNKMCYIVAGSQGQEGSSLVRAIYGEHRDIEINENDKVIFSSDAIPGNEYYFFSAIDELSRSGVPVVYPDIAEDLHVSGHAAAMEQKLLIAMTKPKYLFPIGGSDRHRKLFADLAKGMGYKHNEILIPGDGEIVKFESGSAKKGRTLHLKELMVDGKGVGDVGTVVLSDRKALSQDGMIVLVVPQRGGKLLTDKIEIVSRGFVFVKQSAEFLDQIRQEAQATIQKLDTEKLNNYEFTRKLERRLSRKIRKWIGREPVILPVIMEV